MTKPFPQSATRRRSAGQARPGDLPFVLVNVAITADGKIATANREVSSFGSRRDHQHLMELRATADAVMAGARTVDANRIHLGPGGVAFRRLRLKRGLAEYNLRVIVTGSGSVDPAAHIFTRRFSPLLVLTSARARQVRLRRLRALADQVRVCGRSDVNLRRALRWLRARHGVRRLVCEGGGELNDALFRANLVDELHVTICPLVFGGRGAPTLAEGSGFPRLAAARQFELHRARRFGDELFLVLRRRVRLVPARHEPQEIR
jgi:riboflavin-specific deaminase-like protein